MNEMEPVSEPKTRLRHPPRKSSPNDPKRECFIKHGFNILLPILILNKGDRAAIGCHPILKIQRYLF